LQQQQQQQQQQHGSPQCLAQRLAQHLATRHSVLSNSHVGQQAAALQASVLPSNHHHQPPASSSYWGSSPPSNVTTLSESDKEHSEGAGSCAGRDGLIEAPCIVCIRENNYATT
jgi:hypothetical protein